MFVADSKRLTAAGAKKMMATAIASAEQAGIPVTVAIADAGGNLLLLERMEGGRFHTVHSATTKAVCAASNRRPDLTRAGYRRVDGRLARNRGAARSSAHCDLID